MTFYSERLQDLCLDLLRVVEELVGLNYLICYLLDLFNSEFGFRFCKPQFFQVLWVLPRLLNDCVDSADLNLVLKCHVLMRSLFDDHLVCDVHLLCNRQLAQVPGFSWVPFISIGVIVFDPF